jgi:hypothetical protein
MLSWSDSSSSNMYPPRSVFKHVWELAVSVPWWEQRSNVGLFGYTQI